MRKNMKLIGLAVSLTCCAGFIDAQEANEPQERQQQEKHLLLSFSCGFVGE